VKRKEKRRVNKYKNTREREREREREPFSKLTKKIPVKMMGE